MGILKNILNSIIRKDESMYRVQNAAFDMSIKMNTILINSLIKRLLIYRFMNSEHYMDKAYVEDFRKNFMPGKKTLDEDDIAKLVDVFFQMTPETQLLGLPEATIATISEAYHSIKRRGELSNDEIFKELDRTRNANHLSNFKENELTLENYIIHVMRNEDENNVMDRIDINFLKKQIQLANEYGLDHNARAKDTTRAMVLEVRNRFQ